MRNIPFPKLSDEVLRSKDPEVLRTTLEDYYHIAKILDSQYRTIANENRTLRVMHRFKFN